MLQHRKGKGLVVWTDIKSSVVHAREQSCKEAMLLLQPCPTFCRAFVFLKKCGSGNLLLRYVKLDASAETLMVLTALEKFIRDKGIQFT